MHSIFIERAISLLCMSTCQKAVYYKRNGTTISQYSTAWFSKLKTYFSLFVLRTSKTFNSIFTFTHFDPPLNHPAPNPGFGSLLAARPWKKLVSLLFFYYLVLNLVSTTPGGTSAQLRGCLLSTTSIKYSCQQTAIHRKKFPIRKYALDTKILECQYAALSQNRKDREKMWAKLRHK